MNGSRCGSLVCRGDRFFSLDPNYDLKAFIDNYRFSYEVIIKYPMKSLLFHSFTNIVYDSKRFSRVRKLFRVRPSFVFGVYIEEKLYIFGVS